MPLVFDPLMENEDNLIILEEHDLTDPAYLFGCAVFPSELGADGEKTPFFEDDLVVMLSVDDGSTWYEAQPFRDFTFGPMHVSLSVLCAKNVYSNILVYNPADKLVQMTYRGVGDRHDATYLAEIVAAGAFDRDDPANWLLFQGQAKNLDASQVDSDVAGQSPLEVLNTFLGKLVNLMTGAGEISPTLLDLIGATVGDLEAWKNEIINAIPVISGGGGGLEPIADKLVLLSGRPALSTHLGAQVSESLIGNNVTILAALQNIDAAVRAFKTQYINTVFVNGVTSFLPYDGGITLNTSTFFLRGIYTADGSRYRYNYESLVPSYVTTGNWAEDQSMLIGLDGDAKNISVHQGTPRHLPLQTWVNTQEGLNTRLFSNTVAAQIKQGRDSVLGAVYFSSTNTWGQNATSQTSQTRWPQKLNSQMKWKGTFWKGMGDGSSQSQSLTQGFWVMNACAGVNGDVYVYRRPYGSGSAGLAFCLRRYTNVFQPEGVAFDLHEVFMFQRPTGYSLGDEPTLSEWGTTAFVNGGSVWNPSVDPTPAASDIIHEMHACPFGTGLFFSTYKPELQASTGYIYTIFFLSHSSESGGTSPTKRTVYQVAPSDEFKPECFTVDRHGNLYIASYTANRGLSSVQSKITRVNILRGSSSWSLSTEVINPDALGGVSVGRITAMKVTPKGHIYLAYHGVKPGGSWSLGSSPSNYVNWMFSLVNPTADTSVVYPALSTYQAGARALTWNDPAWVGPRDIQQPSSIGYQSKFLPSSEYVDSANWANSHTVRAIRRLELDENETCYFGAASSGVNVVGDEFRTLRSSAILAFNYGSTAGDDNSLVVIHRSPYQIDQFAIRPQGGGRFVYGEYRYDEGGIAYTAKAPNGNAAYAVVAGDTRVDVGGFAVFENLKWDTTTTARALIQTTQWNPWRASPTDSRNFMGCENPKVFTPCGPYELGGWGVKF